VTTQDIFKLIILSILHAFEYKTNANSMFVCIAYRYRNRYRDRDRFPTRIMDDTDSDSDSDSELFLEVLLQFSWRRRIQERAGYGLRVSRCVLL
jgi:hypothetical protein